jgi:hypothetical protein
MARSAHSWHRRGCAGWDVVARRRLRGPDLGTEFRMNPTVRVKPGERFSLSVLATPRPGRLVGAAAPATSSSPSANAAKPPSSCSTAFSKGARAGKVRLTTTRCPGSSLSWWWSEIIAGCLSHGEDLGYGLPPADHPAAAVSHDRAISACGGAGKGSGSCRAYRRPPWRTTSAR